MAAWDKLAEKLAGFGLGDLKVFFVTHRDGLEMAGSAAGHNERELAGIQRRIVFSITLTVKSDRMPPGFPRVDLSVHNDKMERIGPADLWRIVRQRDSDGAGFVNVDLEA